MLRFIADFIHSAYYWLVCFLIFSFVGLWEFSAVLDNQNNDAYFLLWFVSAAGFLALFLYNKDKDR